ncbi:MAG: NAD(P)/FAD-dependent oxidoreductase [Elusimicrobiaceae bacterium]
MEKTAGNIIVIGGGASGLMAALTAAKAGAKVVLLEKNNALGKKLSASGNGCCNLTNTNMAPDFYTGKTEFIETVLDTFPVKEELAFFESLGLILRAEQDGRIFPKSDRAVAVTSVLELELEDLGVEIHMDFTAERIAKHNGKFTVTGANGAKFETDRLILACGSRAYPQLGGTDLGTTLAACLGHRVNKPVPVLAPLAVLQKGIARLQGIRIDAELTALQHGKTLGKAKGELLFTDYGISGPCTLNLSNSVVPALSNGKVTVSMNLFPELSPDEMRAFLSGRRAVLAGRKVKKFFVGWLHETLGNLLIDFLGLEKNKPARQLSDSDLARIADTLQHWEFDIVSSRTWREAMCACGGVDVADINPRTLESKIEKGLYITGELLDVNGLCGGYNLHFAWTTGRLAGLSAAR